MVCDWTNGREEIDCPEISGTSSNLTTKTQAGATMTTLTFWRERGGEARQPSFRRVRSLFLRGLGLVYLAAFGSMAVQVDGLIGSHGILPAAEYLALAGRMLGRGPAAYWRLPTLCWLNASDWALHALCWGGIALSVALVVGILPGLCAALLWLFYLSLVVSGQDFLNYQWDSLLLEAGLLAVLLAPWGIWLGRARDDPWAFSIWLVRWLVFRLMFLSGLVKLASQDPAWLKWKALEYHYQTQPLPVWTSWYIQQMPACFHAMSVGLMFFAELIAPFFVVGPRPIRLVGFASLVTLQGLIAGTGNYGFFNLLAVVLCLTLLDDRDVQWMQRVVRQALERRTRSWSWGRDRTGPGEGRAAGDSEPSGTARSWSMPRRSVIGFLGGAVIVLTAAQTVERVWPEVIVPSELILLEEWVQPLRSFNSYGLFAVMTKKRPEIVVEGSDDGLSWKPYRFRWKPCELDRRPMFTTPHMPRLDWQMWFAALSAGYRGQTWFLRFERRLLAGEPEVLGLLRDNPFPARPPRYVRARLFLYKFSEWGAVNWWTREDRGLFCPAVSLADFE